MMDGMLPTNSPALMPITTPRLLLRAYHADDALALQQLDLSDDRQCCHGPRSTLTAPVRQSVLQTAIGPIDYPRSRYAMVIELCATHQVIGVCGLSISRSYWSEAELLYAIVPRFQGHGYASEAAAALLTFGFEELQLRRIFGMCRTDDIGSGRVMEKIGMVREGRLREHAREENHWREWLLYAIFDRDWSNQGLRERYVC